MDELKPISTVDPGELLLETVKNALHVVPELQLEVAQFMRVWSSPLQTIQPIKVEFPE